MKQKVLLCLVLSLIACLLVSTSVLGAYSGYYQIRNARNTQMYIDGMGTTENGADLAMWSNTTHYNSHWEIIDVGGGYYQLKCRTTGMFIDGMGRTNTGDPCGQWANTGHYNSHWKIAPDKGYVRFQNRETGRYLDSNGQTSNGAVVVQRSGRSDLAQRWTLVSMGGGGTQPTSPPGPTATPKPGPTATPKPGPTPTPKPGPTPTSGGGGGPVPSGLVGFATLNGGTTGGQGGTTVTVSTGTALQAEIKKGGPRIIRVNGTINTSNSSGLSKIDVKDVNNITIIGVGTSGEFNGIGIKVTRANNIIIRNLKIHHVRTGDKDCISIEGPVNNIWVDHCDLYNQFQGVDKDYYDALLDTKKNAAYHTFSWNKLHDSWKASLAGSSESDTSDRRVTYHHNSFININSRLPLYRSGQGHVYNNHYKDVPTTAVNSRINAKLRVEYNYFENVNNCIGSWDSDVIGYWHVVNNVFSNCSGSQPTSSTCSYNPPYSYSVESTSSVRSTISSNAGIGKI